MKNSLILSILLLFLVSCAQIKALQDNPASYDSQSEKILTEKAEDRGINLPEGSSIIEKYGLIQSSRYNNIPIIKFSSKFQ